MGNLKKKNIRNHINKIMEVFPYDIKEKQFDAVSNVIHGKDTKCVFYTNFFW